MFIGIACVGWDKQPLLTMQRRQKLAEAAAAKATEQVQDAAMLAVALSREREEIAAEQARKAANSRNQHLYRSSSKHTRHAFKLLPTGGMRNPVHASQQISHYLLFTGPLFYADMGQPDHDAAFLSSGIA